MYDGSHRESTKIQATNTMIVPTKPNFTEIFDNFQQNARDMNVSKIRESRKKLDCDIQKLQTRIIQL